jgi:hypothetical protein
MENPLHKGDGVCPNKLVVPPSLEASPCQRSLKPGRQWRWWLLSPYVMEDRSRPAPSMKAVLLGWLMSGASIWRRDAAVRDLAPTTMV